MVEREEREPVNMIVLLVDDLGRGDLGAYGNDTVSTPHIDQLARAGATFRAAYAAASICTPSRAALLTGRYPVRSGMANDDPAARVLRSPGQLGGLPSGEVTLAEAFKSAGYRTAMVGKWHIGTGSGGQHLPNRHGFDSYYGMPVTNVQPCGDVHIFEGRPYAALSFLETHRAYALLYAAKAAPYFAALAAGALALAWLGALGRRGAAACAAVLLVGFCAGYYVAVYNTLMTPGACYLQRDGVTVERPVRLQNLTARYTREAERFIRGAAEDGEPFFLFMSYAKVHTALFTMPQNAGRSRAGAYGDNVEEMDWSVGRIMQALRDNGLGNNTLVVFTSDNGPWLERGEEGGFAGYEVTTIGERKPLKGGKTNNFEGGIRVPLLVWGTLLGRGVAPSGVDRAESEAERAPAWRVPAGLVTSEVTSLMDIFPTALDMTGQLITDGRIIDGRSLLPLFDMLERHGGDGVRRAQVDEAAGGRVGALQQLSKAAARRSFSSAVPLSPGEHHGVLFHYCGQQVSAARVGDYKVHWSTPIFDGGGQTCAGLKVCHCVGDHVQQHSPPLVFDLRSDPGESRALGVLPGSAAEAVVQRAERALAAHRARVATVKNQLQTIFLPTVFYENVCCNGIFDCDCREEGDDAAEVAPAREAAVDGGDGGRGARESAEGRRGEGELDAEAAALADLERHRLDAR